MNNFERMESVQKSLEQLASAKEDTDEQKSAAVEANSSVERSDEVENNDEENGNVEKNPNVETEETVPEVSTVQEQLSQSDYYTVKKGDTLASISKKTYGDSGHVEAICKMNGLTDGNLIFIGQKLLLP